MKKRYKFLIGLCCLIGVGFLMPYSFQNPVEGATVNDYNQKSFWYYPWGTSVTHKGVDIFKRKGTPIHPASGVEWVLYAGGMPGKGGNVVVTLAPKWRLHYYAHMDKVSAVPLSVVTHGSELGTVGNSGNAAKTPSHLHFGMGSIFLWQPFTRLLSYNGTPLRHRSRLKFHSYKDPINTINNLCTLLNSDLIHT